jgi:hypothetical protein
MASPTKVEDGVMNLRWQYAHEASTGTLSFPNFKTTKRRSELAAALSGVLFLICQPEMRSGEMHK